MTVEELAARLDRLPTSRFHIMVLLVAGFALFFDTLDQVLGGFAFAAFRQEWNLGGSTLGITSAIALVGYLAGSAVVGPLADRFGRKTVLSVSLLLYSLFSASRALSGGIVSFTVLNFLTWACIAMESCVVPLYLAELWPSRLRGRFHGWMMGFFAFGIALSPVWALLLMPSVGWRWMLALTAPFALLIGLVRGVLPESPRWLLSRGRVADAERVLAGIESRVARRFGGHLPPAGDRVAPRVAVTATGRNLLGGNLLPVTSMIWLVWFVEYGVLYLLLTVLPTMLAAEGFSIVRSTQFSIVIFSGFIPGYTLSGYFLDWIDRKFWLMICFAGIAVSGTLFGYVSTPEGIMACAWFLAYFLGGGSTAIYMYTPELYPTAIRATAMGFASVWGRIGAIVQLLLFSLLAILQGRLYLFAVSDALLVIGIVAVALIGPRTRQRTLEASSTAAAVETLE
jgi:putative MFS transporter